MSPQTCTYCYYEWSCPCPSRQKQYKKDEDKAIDEGVNYTVPCKHWMDDSLSDDCYDD